MTLDLSTEIRTARRTAPLAVLCLLAAATLAAYWPALHAGYVWDDDSYLTENPVLREPGGLARIWLEPRATPQYYPLVFTTFWLELRLWGLAPLGYHLVNVLLHATSAFLLWRLLVRLVVPGALFAALLFALHPVHVESVAWVTERKNTLSMALALGAASAWLRFRPLEGGGGSRASQALALLLFAGALLSKSVTGILPFVLGTLVWWKRGRLAWRDVGALLPLLLLAVPFGLNTAQLEREHVGAQGVEWSFTLLDRVVLAGRAFWFYAQKLAWPHPLTFFYPRVEPEPATQWLPALAVVALFAFLLLAQKRLGRGPLAACVLFGLGIGPASGFFDVYPMRFSFVADHFQYHASYALLVLAAAGLTRGPGRLVAAPGARALAAALPCALLGALTWSRCRAFSDAETLWLDTLAKNETSWAAHSHLAAIAMEAGRKEEAYERYLLAARHCPFPSEAWADAAYVHIERGAIDEALALYGPILRAHPIAAERLVAIADQLLATERRADATRLYALLAAETPDFVPGRVGYGDALSIGGLLAEARTQYEAALALEPDGPRAADAAFGLGASRARGGDFAAAIPHLERAVRLRPGWEKAQRALAEARRQAGGS